VRGLLERFESRVLPLFVRRTKGVSKLIPQLYLHGLALGDFGLALRGLLGGGALANIYPRALEQRCWNHKMVNVLDKLPKKLKGQAKRHLQGIVYSETREVAEAERDEFVRWCRAEGYCRTGETLLRDWDRMVTFYQFPQEHWRHLRTTNVVESPFAGLRLRTNAAKRYKKVENATAVIWKMLQLAEQRFHRLGAPEKLIQVYLEFGFQERSEKTETKQEEVLALA
jgi:putative transposase